MMIKSMLTATLFLMINNSILSIMIYQPSLMCISLTIQILLSSIITSMLMKLSPIPFIIFLTMIGGLMIIFLYMTSTMWDPYKNKTINTLPMMMTLTITAMISMKMMKIKSIPKPNLTSMFEMNLNNSIIMIMSMLLIMLAMAIEISMKMNQPIRRKLKIWE